MSPDAREAVAACGAQCATVATTLRTIMSNPDSAADKREQDGLAVLAAELDSIVEGINTLLSGGGGT